jgi:hypothetical protein
MTASPTPMIKFGFRIRTRSGLPVDNLVVHARDQAEAEKRISQMYLHCEILDCKQIQAPSKDDGTDIESILSLIARQPDD